MLSLIPKKYIGGVYRSFVFNTVHIYSITIEEYSDAYIVTAKSYKALTEESKVYPISFGQNDDGEWQIRKILSKHRNLQALSFVKGYLKDCPVGLEKIKTLESINLSYNRMTFIPVAVLTAWSNLPYLKELDLSYNDLTYMNNIFSDLNQLSVLNLLGNKFFNVPSFLFGMPNLQVIKLSVIEGGDKVPTWLFKLPMLNVLELECEESKLPVDLNGGDSMICEFIFRVVGEMSSEFPAVCRNLIYLLKLTLHCGEFCRVFPEWIREFNWLRVIVYTEMVEDGKKMKFEKPLNKRIVDDSEVVKKSRVDTINPSEIKLILDEDEDGGGLWEGLEF